MKSPFNVETILGGKATLEPETVLGGKYVLKSFAGRGGMGEVWRAWDVVGGRFVALKFIASEVRKRDKETLRTQETFRMTGELNHQNICPNYGLEYDSKFGLYLAMKWLNGVSLDEIIRYNKAKQGRVPPYAIFQILRPLAEALDYSHSRLILHRDVKPSNVFVTIRNGKIIDVYLIDFGLASLTRNVTTNETSGTCLYMAPEQWRGDAQNSQTDLYALGVIAYEIYAGKPPFYERNVEALRCAVLHEPPPPVPLLSSEANAVLARCLAKKREARYKTCLEFVQALENAVRSTPPDPSAPVEILAPKRVRQFVASSGEKNSEASGKTSLFRRVKDKKADNSFDVSQKRFVESKTTRVALISFASTALLAAILGFAFVAFKTIQHLID